MSFKGLSSLFLDRDNKWDFSIETIACIRSLMSELVFSIDKSSRIIPSFGIVTQGFFCVGACLLGKLRRFIRAVFA